MQIPAITAAKAVNSHLSCGSVPTKAAAIRKTPRDNVAVNDTLHLLPVGDAKDQRSRQSADCGRRSDCRKCRSLLDTDEEQADGYAKRKSGEHTGSLGTDPFA